MDNSSVVNKNDLVALGFKVGTATSIIRQAKYLMINKGFTFYENKRLGAVPRSAVEEILGIKLGSQNVTN
ncbi:DUF3173 domain-containing protein [Lactococcus raffinolactis]|uniref:DUF3173 domain-containing protein n=1 Tax=Pseudolactococcus raffinolactis TaxID=1366 RepID=UPI0034CEF638